MDKNHGNRDDFYVFSTRNGDAENTVKMLIENKLVNVITDLAANCIFMSEGIFEFVTGGNASPLECKKKVYA